MPSPDTGSRAGAGHWWRAGRWGRRSRGPWHWPFLRPDGPAILRRLGSVRFRAALASAVAATLAFGLGALWMRSEIYDSRMDSATRQATLTAQAVISDSFTDPDVPRPTPNRSDWAVALPDGRVVVVDGALNPYLLSGRITLPVVDGDLWAGWSNTFTLHSQSLDMGVAQPFDDKDVRFAVVASGPVDAARMRALAERYGVPAATYGAQEHVLAYVAVLPDEAEAAVAAVDRALAGAVPVGVLFVALMAWFVTGRALRPVEEIRERLAQITGHELHRRVPVPPSGDEITRLAVTTNATLDRLEEAVARQRGFVADAAHELRSPLASLRTGMEVTLAHPEGVDWPAEFGRTLHEARRLGGLTDDLLLLARLDRTTPAGRPTAGRIAQDGASGPGRLAQDGMSGNPDGRAWRPVDLADLACEQVAERGYLHPDGPRFAARADGPAVVAGDESHLSRLLRNLLDNAARHAATEVVVTVTRDDARVTVVVADDGPGIAPADRERIFERFTRLDAARDRDSGGTGLGLAIARDLAAQHRGTLRATDSPLGARFELDLPRNL
ncbi:hypothetical protein Lfu02_63820 [Longispora fulva]|uniref:histidine kinase n=1 Tax=Longispora fulva TaxID=619741 RepID=A0A8J7GAJ0_9ACTN|nr:HAMP domain-containing sensor histidine kinase [Longispora fulva]MBG6134799.1 signal transduction histidine kinase [Longispora fulva]GIG62010.1 hypothetical protein Lfu02_63820 [Longispora fulva]